MRFLMPYSTIVMYNNGLSFVYDNPLQVDCHDGSFLYELVYTTYPVAQVFYIQKGSFVSEVYDWTDRVI
jgi:hypothetical protein